MNTIKEINIIAYEPKGYYASHWGLTDLYPEVEQELQKLIESKKPFVTSSLDSKKEIGGWSMSRAEEDGNISISVWAAMDEGYDLIYDATEEELTSEEETEALDYFYEECSSELESHILIEASSTLDDILLEVSSVYDELTNELHSYFEIMVDIVNAILKNRNNEK